ncbi:hypothetical protein I8746_10500 [Pseudomonas sp. USTB-Z]|uniref:hypothetical protein n=1 Tax=Pseudomonas sp. USTB-Z TaxID=2794351 RepID=UPI001C838F25|nr:hypothetical protein [Pseudomonas sp. USTB-Z]MBX6690032.1 hypothetical protein [Pseudomonas sp. USTB-Z]
MMKSQKKIKGIKLSLDPRLLLRRREEREEDTAHRVQSLIYQFDAANENELIYQVASHAWLPSMLNPVYGKSRRHYELATAPYRLTALGYESWATGLFAKNSRLLTSFNKLRNQLNIYILQNDHTQALSTLDRIDDLCKSWWSIGIRTHILKELRKEDTKAFLADLPSNFPTAKIETSVFKLQLMSESNAIGVFLSNLNARLREYRSSEIPRALGIGAIESCRHLPYYLDSERKPELGYVVEECHESIIDQFIIFKEVALELSFTLALPSELKSKVQKLATLIADTEFESILLQPAAPSDIVAKIVENYTLARYQKVIDDTTDLLNSGHPASFCLIEIYAKAKIYINSPFSRNSFFDSISADLASILQCEASTAEKIEYLTKICVKFRNEPWAKSLTFHLLSVLEETTESDAVEHARLETLSLGCNNTPKAINGATAFTLIPRDQQKIIPSYRAAKYFPSDSSPSEITEDKFPVKSDYLKLKARALIKAGCIKEVMNFTAREYQKNRFSFYHLPFSKVCERIVEASALDSDTKLLCLITLDIYNKEHSSRYEELKSEIFEDFFLIAGTHRPSILFQNEELNCHTTFFLQNLCITTQLDNLFQYRNNDEVVHERVAIIDLLIKANPKNKAALRAERDKVLESLFAEKLRAKIESGKLYVDIQAFEGQRKQLYENLYAQAKALTGGVQLEPLANVSELETSKDLFKLSERDAIASTEKTELLYTIHMYAIEDFALNETYGLDKYLSAEIRHMVFVAQLRSCFEKTKLLTAKKNGVYLPNTFWLKEYMYVNSELTQAVDSVLGEFSKKVDDLLEMTNEQFRVTIRQDNEAGMFDFIPYHSRLVSLSNIITKSESFDKFFEQLIQYLWDIAGQGAKKAQLLISNDLASDLCELIDDLERSITEIRGNVPMVDLMREIRTARSNVLNEIDIVTNWFKFVGSRNSNSLERLGSVVEATVSSFESIYGHIGRELQFTQTKSDLFLSYREARSLFVAIFTALENAFKYSENHTPVAIEHVNSDQHNQIIISNQPAPKIQNPDEFVREQKSKWTPIYANLNRQEGGTGLYKIFSSLSDTSQGFSFDIEVTENLFTACLGIQNEHFDNRRQLPQA